MSSNIGYQLGKDYSKGNIIGWAEVTNPGIADEAFKLISGVFIPFKIVGQTRSYKGKKTFLHHVVKQVLGAPLLNFAQEIGDCVSFGCRNATDYLGCCDILMRKEAEKYRPSFPPYFYGTGRVLIGNGQLGDEDGSLGSWMAAAVIKYGTIFRDESGCPDYSGSLAKQWGGGQGPPKKWVDFGSNYLIRSAAKINSWEELCEAINNGYPCTVASNQGFSMEPGSDGFHNAEGNWGHQMCITGVDEEYKEPYALIRNSWGPEAMGHLKDFADGDDIPGGYIRAKRRVVESMIQAGETFAYSQYDQFKEQKIDDALFKIGGV